MRGSLIESRGTRHAQGDRVHFGRRLEPRLAVGLWRELAQRAQHRRGIQHVAGDGIVGLEVACGITEHRGCLGVVSELEHGHRVAQAGGGARCGVVAHHLEGDGAGECVGPPTEQFARTLGLTAGERLPHVGSGAEEDSDGDAVGTTKQGPQTRAGERRGRTARAACVGRGDGSRHACPPAPLAVPVGK